MISSQYRVYLVLSVLVLSSWFLADLFEEDEFKKIKAVGHSPDYFSTGYHKLEMNEDGVAKNELFADKMFHYADDGTTHLESPVMTLYNSDKPPWVIKSETGILEADGDHLLLAGKVFISRDGINSDRPFKINTSNLYVQLSINYAETVEWGEIIDGQNRTEGVGMETTFVDPVRLKFLSKVKGRYEFN